MERPKLEFGTDGVRGKANETLPLYAAYRLGSFLGWHYRDSGSRGILVGKDTRLSGGMYESALAAGISSRGVSVYLAGFIPTPAIAHLVVAEKFACGVMISASHNPYTDNGIKVFSPRGAKLDRRLEESIEAYLNSSEEYPMAAGSAIGAVIDWRQGREEYLSWLRETHPLNLQGKKIALDAANGSASFTAKELLESLGASVDAYHDQPDGLNINRGCGSTHPEDLQRIMKEGDYDIGFAFDGDADRLIAAAPDGQLVDGDKTIYSLGKWMKSKGKLKDSMVVATVMANLGFFKKCREAHLETTVTPVGDKYVYEQMVKNGYQIGGEQSGHVIFLDQETTGDGLVTALNLLAMMLDTGKGINELTDDLKVYPQVLINVRVPDKKKAMEDPRVTKAVKEAADELGEEGRVLVRPSGTEPFLRVMVEARSDEECRRYAERIAGVIREASGGQKAGG